MALDRGRRRGSIGGAVMAYKILDTSIHTGTHAELGGYTPMLTRNDQGLRGYGPLRFPIPTPTQLGRLGVDTMPLQLAPYSLQAQTPEQAVEAVSGGPPSVSNPGFVAGPNGQWLNVYTGQLVDTETMALISQAAQANPALMAQPLSSLPSYLLSPAMEESMQSFGVQTAASIGVGPSPASSGFTAWFENSTSIGGKYVPNWMLAGGGLALAYVLFGGKSRRRR